MCSPGVQSSAPSNFRLVVVHFNSSVFAVFIACSALVLSWFARDQHAAHCVVMVSNGEHYENEIETAQLFVCLALNFKCWLILSCVECFEFVVVFVTFCISGNS